MKNNGMGREKAYNLTLEQQSHEGEPRLNVATYTQTYADKYARMVTDALVIKNAINRSDYPEISAMEMYCLKELAQLYGLPNSADVIGTSTAGSSEACYTAALAMLRRWKEYHKAAGNWRTPNLIISTAHHVCWDKFAAYHDVELREVPVSLRNPVLDPARVVELIDKDTIGIVATLGGTHLGLYDDVKDINERLNEFNALSFFPVYIHVDAASGGLYAPFTDPEYMWDFRLNNVVSINVSGHKYGLVPAAIGWLLWRSKEYLPESLRKFSVPYLGSTQQATSSKPR